MKRTLIINLSLIVLLLGACAKSNPTITPSESPAPQPNVNNETKSTLDERTKNALLDALADERRAQAFYGAVIKKFGDVRPFSNIIQAEQKHEAHLLPLFQKYGVTVPKNEEANKEIKVPESIIDACKQGVEAEKMNLEMYNRFLGFVKEQDIREAFTWLRDASQNNHLPAFERCTQGGGEPRGKGRYGRT
jgi:hypothetical protein